MAKYRNNLPQVAGDKLFLTDGGMETDLLFNRGADLPHFAAVWQHHVEGGEDILREYFAPYFATAKEKGAGFILESVSWRASRDWAEPLGLSVPELAALNTRAITFMKELRDEYETEQMPVVISGCIGPRGDGYDPGKLMTPEDAEDYHSWQVELLAKAGADQITAMTITNVPEAIGFANAAKAAGIPIAISFTVETDGSLPTGQALGNAINEVDEATDGYAAYFMVNCAHPTHFGETISSGEAWTNRIYGIRANASSCSHEELDNATELDDGNPVELGSQYAELQRALPQLRVFGGCCGTDHRHLKEIAGAVMAPASKAA